jgi:hypothetical protein
LVSEREKGDRCYVHCEIDDGEKARIPAIELLGLLGLTEGV